MHADKVLRSIIERNNTTIANAARQLGKSDSYFSGIFSRGSIPKTDTYAGILDTFGYDLIARDRDDGFEFLIDPPK